MTLRYGLIGTGMMGLEHQRNLNAIDGVDVVAAADPVQEDGKSDAERRWLARACADVPGLTRH